MMQEWFNWQPWKGCGVVRLPRVRISLIPPKLRTFMIKRDGKIIRNLNYPQTNNLLAKDTLKIIENKQYTTSTGKVIDLSKEIDFSIKNTLLYNNNTAPYKTNTESITFEVVNETATQSALRLLNAGKENIVILNFASAINPGGGFLMGAVAQEEDLARRSGLYACLKSKPAFYNANNLCDKEQEFYYTNNILYSPNVPFFRDEKYELLEEPYTLSVISAPAPNVSLMSEINESLIFQTLHTRATQILQIAAEHNHKNIILGAWGCGAFGNSAKMVASIFDLLLKTVTPHFEHVCFAVYDKRPDEPIFKTFKNIIV